jgi:hypothetical protein
MPIEVPLAERQARLCYLIDQRRDAQLDYGFVWNARRWQANVRSSGNLTGTLTAIGCGFVLPDGFVWRDADNVDLPVTLDDLRAFALAMMSFAATVTFCSFALKNAITASDAPESIDLTAGWPEPTPPQYLPPVDQ